MNPIQKRLEEIEQNLKDFLYYATDCAEADEYRLQVPWLLNLAKRQAEVIAKMDEALKKIGMWDLPERFQDKSMPQQGYFMNMAREAREECRKLLEEDLE